jgi:hypothetical protein
VGQARMLGREGVHCQRAEKAQRTLAPDMGWGGRGHRRSHGDLLDDVDTLRQWRRRTAGRPLGLRSALNRRESRCRCTTGGRKSSPSSRRRFPTLGRSRSRSRTLSRRCSPEPRIPPSGRKPLPPTQSRTGLAGSHLLPRRREEVPTRDCRRARSRRAEHFRRPRNDLRQILVVRALIRQRPKP